MTIVSVPQNSFTGGEWAPSMVARNGLAKYDTACRIMRNMYPHPHGPFSNRAGTEFIVETKYSDKHSRLIPFQFSTVQAYMLEFGEEYIRVIKDGGQVLNSPRSITSIVNSTYKWTPSAFGALVPVSIRSTDYKWTVSPSAYSDVSLNDNDGWSEVSQGGIPEEFAYSITSDEPISVTEKGTANTLEEVGLVDLQPGEWKYNAGKIFVRLSDDRSPNSHGDGYVRARFRYTYYLELAAGGDTGLGVPFEIQNAAGSVSHTRGELPALAGGEWDYGDSDSLGYDTIYLRLSGNGDPDSETADSINAAYAEEYYLEIAEGGTPNLLEPTYIYEDDTNLLGKGVPGLLGLAEWGYGDNDTLGYDTIYVRMTEGNGPDPDGEAEDFLEARYHTATSLVDEAYQWTASGAGTNEYYVELAASGDPSIVEPVLVYEDGATAVEGTLGTLAAGEWAYGDNDTLGYSTLYIRLTDNVDPDTKKAGYVEASNVVEIETPYAEEDLQLIKYEQSNDVIYLFHNKYPTRKLSRLAHDTWNLEVVEFGAAIEPPTDLTCTGATISYVVTAVDANERESVASEATEGSEGNAISWTPVFGAAYYNVYKDDKASGFYGWIGQADDANFTEPSTKLLPDPDESPPGEANKFEGLGEYPGVGTFFEQRLTVARTDNKPQSILGSRTGDFENFNRSKPLKDDDSYDFTLNARQLNEIRWLVPLSKLIIGTSASEWKMSNGSQSNAVTPRSVDMKMQSQYGVSHLRPLVIGNTILFLEAAGDVVRDLAYSLEQDSHVGNDLSILANHLFQGFEIVDWCFERDPNSIIWAVRNDGKMIGLTYFKEHQVSGWHRHDTDGSFEHVASIRTSAGVDEVYMIVSRTIDGSDKRYIERFRPRLPVNDSYEYDVADAYFVDCGLTYEGAEATTISGLDHLEGKTVVALADGNVVKDLTVTSGDITLPNAAVKVHIGLPFVSDLETLDIDYPTESGTVQDKIRSIPSVVLTLENTRSLWIGPDEDNLIELAFRDQEDYGEATELFTGDKEINIEAGESREGRIFIRNEDPLPLTVLSIIARVDNGES